MRQRSVNISYLLLLVYLCNNNIMCMTMFCYIMTTFTNITAMFNMVLTIKMSHVEIFLFINWYFRYEKLPYQTDDFTIKLVVYSLPLLYLMKTMCTLSMCRYYIDRDVKLFFFSFFKVSVASTSDIFRTGVYHKWYYCANDIFMPNWPIYSRYHTYLLRNRKFKIGQNYLIVFISIVIGFWCFMFHDILNLQN